jgi:hypothetical protein
MTRKAKAKKDLKKARILTDAQVQLPVTVGDATS